MVGCGCTVELAGNGSRKVWRRRRKYIRSTLTWSTEKAATEEEEEDEDEKEAEQEVEAECSND